MLAKKPLIPVPPEKLYKKIGAKDKHDFLVTAFASLDSLIEIGGLKPTDHVLDIGCGIGRAALALSTYLNEKGSYDGIDIIKEFILWCRNNIADKFPNFRFSFLNLYHPIYNPFGTKRDPYKLPYIKESFDFIYLISIFSDLLPSKTFQVLSEISRLLKPGGKVYMTAFLINEHTKKLIKENKNSQNRNFTYSKDLHAYTTNKNPLISAFGYNEKEFIGQLENLGFSIENITYGFWRGIDNASFSEDIVVVKKND